MDPNENDLKISDDDLESVPHVHVVPLHLQSHQSGFLSEVFSQNQFSETSLPNFSGVVQKKDLSHIFGSQQDSIQLSPVSPAFTPDTRESFSQQVRQFCSQHCPSPTCTSSSFSQSVGELSGEDSELDEIGDLLRRFDNYFRERVDSELQSLSEFLHGILSEQQLHLRQILVHSIFNVFKSPPSSQQDNVLELTSHETGSTDAAIRHKQSCDQIEEIHMPMSVTEEPAQAQKTGSMAGHPASAGTELLLELLSLSCQLSALLSQPKFL